MTDPASRDAFEAWMRVDSTLPLDRLHDDTYKDFTVTVMWHAWQAAVQRALAAQQQAPEPVAYLARSRYGSQCHFGMKAAATAWAGEGGEVFEIPLRHLGLVSPAAPQQAAPAPGAPPGFSPEAKASIRAHVAALPAQPGPLDDFGRPIVYDTAAVDAVTHALTGDEGENDSVTVLNSLASYVGHVWPGKTAQQVLIEYEEKQIAEAAQAQPAAVPVNSYSVDSVAWEGFLTDYERYARGDLSMPFSTLRSSLSAVIQSAHPAAAVPAPAVPEGWKLVPVEATPAMCKAAVIFANGSAVYKNVTTEALKIEESIYGEAYAAMLASRPQAEQAQGE